MNERKRGLSHDFCSSVMPPLTTTAFEEETNFHFTASNRSIIHFWLLFQRISQIDYYLRCKTRFQHGVLCFFFVCSCFCLSGKWLSCAFDFSVVFVILFFLLHFFVVLF